LATIILLIIKLIIMATTGSNQHGATLDGVKGDIRELKGMIEDVLFSVNEFANETRQEFVKVWRKMATKQDLAEFKIATKQNFADLEARMVTVDKFDEMESRLATKFVTKAYLDDKLADQTSEIFSRLDRRQNNDRNFKEKLISL